MLYILCLLFVRILSSDNRFQQLQRFRVSQKAWDHYTYIKPYVHHHHDLISTTSKDLRDLERRHKLFISWPWRIRMEQNDDQTGQHVTFFSALIDLRSIFLSSWRLFKFFATISTWTAVLIPRRPSTSSMGDTLITSSLDR